MRFLWSQGLSSSEFPKTWVRLKKKEKTKYYANLYLNYWSPVFHWYFHHLRTYLHTVDHLKFRKVIYDTNSIRYFLGISWFLSSNSSLSNFFIEIESFELSDDFCNRVLLVKVLRGSKTRLQWVRFKSEVYVSVIVWT